MEFKQLQQRALEIREKYAQLEKTKFGKEWTNAQLMKGFEGDVEDLKQIVRAKEEAQEGDTIDKKLAHELSDCLWSVIVLAEKYGIDLEASFMKTMDELDEKLELEFVE